MKIELDYKPTVAQLAEAFGSLDNHEMLAFFEHVTDIYRNGPRGVCALYDQYLAVVSHADMSQDTVTALAHLQRDEAWFLEHYKP